MAMLDDDRDINRGPDLNADVGRRRGKRRICRYCAEKTLVIDYKDPQALSELCREHDAAPTTGRPQSDNSEDRGEFE